MFGRAGRDTMPSTAIVMFRPGQLKARSVDADVRSILATRKCFRKSLVRALDSPFEDGCQEELPCCSSCSEEPDDPYGFFVYHGHFSKKRRPGEQCGRESSRARRKKVRKGRHHFLNKHFFLFRYAANHPFVRGC